MNEKQKYMLTTVIAITAAFTLFVFAFAKMQGRFIGEVDMLVAKIMLAVGAIILLIEYIFYKIWLMKNAK